MRKSGLFVFEWQNFFCLLEAKEASSLMASQSWLSDSVENTPYIVYPILCRNRPT